MIPVETPHGDSSCSRFPISLVSTEHLFGDCLEDSLFRQRGFVPASPDRRQ